MPPRQPRTEFTEDDDKYIVQYLGTYAQGLDRSGNTIWKILGANAENKWAWSHRHPWQSWRNHYVKNQGNLDRRVERWQRKNPQRISSLLPLPVSTPATPGSRPRVSFSQEDDDLLIQFLAKYAPSPTGRLGNKLYKELVEKTGSRWDWARRHPAMSWRERYKNHRTEFDEYILKIQQGNASRAVLKRGQQSTSVEGTSRAATLTAKEEEEESEGDQKVEPAEGSRANGKQRKRRRNSDEDGMHVRKKRRVAESEDESAPRETNQPPIAESRKEHADDVQVHPSETRDTEDTQAEQVAEDLVVNEEEPDEEDLGLPPSDDYSGEIFERPKEDDDATEEEEGEQDEEEEEEEEEYRKEEDEDEEEEIDELEVSSVLGLRETEVDRDGVRPTPDEIPQSHAADHIPRPSSASIPSHRPRQPEEDIFESLPSSPNTDRSQDSTLVQHTRKREPPRLDEGAFNTAFTDSKGRRRSDLSKRQARTSGVEDDAETEAEGDGDGGGVIEGEGDENHLPAWPPNRRKGKSKATEVELMPDAASKGPTVKHEPQDSAPKDALRTPLPPVVSANEVPVTVRQHHPFSQPSQGNGFLVPNHFMPRPHDAIPLKSIVAPQETPSKRPTNHVQQPEGLVDASASRVRFGDSAPDPKLKGNEREPLAPPPRPRRQLSGQKAERNTVETARQEGGNINLAQAPQSTPQHPMARPNVRSVDDSWIGTSRQHRLSDSFIIRRVPRASSVEADLQLSEADSSVVVKIGIESAVQAMSENHGFTPAVVRRVWSKAGSLRKADVALGKMREAAEAAALQYLDAGDEDEQEAGPSGERGSRRSSMRSSHTRRESILKFIPARHDEPVVPVLPEYSPPKHSRARQYAKTMSAAASTELLPRPEAEGVVVLEEQAAETSQVDPFAQDQAENETEAAEARWFDDEREASQILTDVVREGRVKDLEEKIGVNPVKIMLGKKLGRFVAGNSA